MEFMVMTARRFGLASSGLGFLGSIYAAIEPNQSISSNALTAAWVAIIAAIGSVVGPWIMLHMRNKQDIAKAEADRKEWIARAEEARKDRESQAKIERELSEERHQFSDRIHHLELDKKLRDLDLERLTEIERKYVQTQIELARTAERLAIAEGKVSKNTAGIAAVKKVVHKTLSDSGIGIAATGFIMCDESGTILGVSGQFSFLLHWNPEDVVGQKVTKLIPIELRPGHEAGMSRASDASVPFSDKTFRNLSAMTKEGNQIPVDLRLTRWVDDNGIRFAALIKEHRPGGDDINDPFPEMPSEIGEMMRNTDALSVTTEALNVTTEALGKLNNSISVDVTE